MSTKFLKGNLLWSSIFFLRFVLIFLVFVCGSIWLCEGNQKDLRLFVPFCLFVLFLHCRIDPKNACRIEDLRSMSMHTSALKMEKRKVYDRGRIVSWVVDSEEYAIIDLEKDITPYFTWNDNHKANFWVLTGSDLTCFLTSDSQLIDLLRASQLVKFLMIVSRCEGNEMPVAVNMMSRTYLVQRMLLRICKLGNLNGQK